MKQQLLDALDKRIAKLQELRAFTAGEDFGDAPNGAVPKRQYSRKVKPPPAKGGTRKDQMHEWLKKNPGSTRAEVIAGTGVPDGTVGGYLSSEKGLFENRDGKWYAR